MYAIVDPFTNVVVQFSQFNMNEDLAKQVDTSSGTPVVNEANYVSVWMETPDFGVLGKTYDSETGTFNP